MKFLGISLHREKRTDARYLFDLGFEDLKGYGANSSGVPVNDKTVLRIAVFLSALKVVAETMGGLPLKSYRRRSPSREEVDDRITDLFRFGPNAFETPAKFMERSVAEVALRGDSFAIIRGKAGERIDYLDPVCPDNVVCIEKSKEKIPRLIYSFRINGKVEKYLQEQVLHIAGSGVGSDPYRGATVIQQTPDTFGTALSASKFAATTFKNQGMPLGLLEYPEGLEEEEIKNIKESWAKEYGGTQNAGKIAILEEGLKFNKIGLTPVDTQLIESRKLSDTELCGLLRVPPHKVGILENMNYNSIEHQAIEFVVDCITPWAIRFEQAFNRLYMFLYGEDKARKFYAKFNMDSLLRGDIKSRFDAYAVARQWGWMSANDILAKEDRNPIGEQGDIYLVPMNMMSADKAKDVRPKDSEPAPADKSKRSDVRLAFSELVSDAIARSIRLESSYLEKLVESDKNLTSEVSKYYSEKHPQSMLERMSKLAVAYRMQIDASNPNAFNRNSALANLEKFVAKYCATSKQEALSVLCSNRKDLPILIEAWTRDRLLLETSRFMLTMESHEE